MPICSLAHAEDGARLAAATTGEISGDGTLKLVGLASGDKITIGTDSGVAHTIQLEDPSGEGRYYLTYNASAIDLNEHLSLAETLASYTVRKRFWRSL